MNGWQRHLQACDPPERGIAEGACGPSGPDAPLSVLRRMALQPDARPQEKLIDGEEKEPDNGQGGDEVHGPTVFVRSDDLGVVGEQEDDPGDEGGADDGRPPEP